MDELEKLLRKAKREDRKRLLEALGKLQQGDTQGLKIKKLVNSQLYRTRIGDFRITFSVDKKLKTLVVESVQRRNESTYR